MALEEVNPFMAVLFFYPYNLIFVFILANMLLAIMNTAYIESNAKTKHSTLNKPRILRVIFYCFFKEKNKDLDDDEDASESQGEEEKNNKKVSFQISTPIETHE